VDVRVQVEPYHWVVGRPSATAAEAWRRKLTTVKHTYLTRIAPHDPGKGAVFDAVLDHILSADTMTWSLAYLVQGTKPSSGQARTPGLDASERRERRPDPVSRSPGHRLRPRLVSPMSAPFPAWTVGQ
jgi:hypothetical protein